VSTLQFTKPIRLDLRRHAELNEKWVQDRIAEDPTILGLGDLVLKDKERGQPRAGRLDLLLQDPESHRRYEIEVQLGGTDESHIIRAIEYWDIERKRYPQYEHCAVIVAEEITGRFLNVINLFNGTIPLIALQMSALQFGEHVTLVFTTVLDEMSRGLVDEDEEVQATADRAYWENQGTKTTLSMADDVLEIIHTFDPSFEFKYNKFYIGLAKDGQPNNFVSFRPKKNNLRVELRLKESPELTDELERAGLDLMDYDKRWGRYRIRLTKGGVKEHRELLTKLLKQTYEASNL
jgi:predicted transport protein